VQKKLETYENTLLATSNRSEDGRNAYGSSVTINQQLVKERIEEETSIIREKNDPKAKS